ncbi:transcriptional regulator NrdR [bacterium]|nr:transcriptional regulator NrdR [bacterium]
MKCPSCDNLENKVVDSRITKEGDIIRRRRECLSCNKRFTTYERIEEELPMVVKKDGRRESFDRLKIINGLKKACEKRQVSIDMIETLVGKVEKWCQESDKKEISTKDIGEEVVSLLHDVDDVAYVRFASVYRSFKDVNEFMTELKDILETKK